MVYAPTDRTTASRSRERMSYDTGAVHASDMLVYRVLVRDQAAIADLRDPTETSSPSATG